MHFNVLDAASGAIRGLAPAAVSARRQVLPSADMQKRTRPDCLALIRPILKSSLSAVSDQANQLCRNRSWALFVIARRLTDREAFNAARGRINDRNHAQQSRSRRPAAGYQGRTR